MRRAALAGLFVLTGARPASVALKVMTYNIHAGQEGLDAVAALINAEAPDLVALQEVDVHWSDRSAFVDQLTALADATGMEARFAPVYSLDPPSEGAPRREYGVALLSRFPVVDSVNHDLTRISTIFGGPPRPMPGFLELTVSVDGRPVRVLCTHLDYRTDPATRATEVEETLRILAARPGPLLLMGDLNAPPDAREIAPLLAELQDAWAVVTPRDAGEGAGLTYPAVDPTKRIDYVLASREWTVRSARLLDTVASDHRAVVAEVELGG